VLSQLSALKCWHPWARKPVTNVRLHSAKIIIIAASRENCGGTSGASAPLKARSAEIEVLDFMVGLFGWRCNNPLPVCI